MKKPFGIVFMGTPEFAVPSLAALCHSPHNVRLVVTQPDRPKGRGRKTVMPPVKLAAERLGVDVIQPDSVRTESVADQLARLKPDVLVVVAFGHILPKSLLQIPKLGAVNIHASLLPKYRGPAPIQWSIINGESETGVTSILMDEGMDTGDILLSQKTAIRPQDTAADLHDRLARLGADLLIQTLTGMQDKRMVAVAQNSQKATYAPMLTKHDGRIDWTRPAHQIEARIRGMTPWPGAYTFHKKTRLKLLRAAPLSMDSDAVPGTVVKGFPDELRIATGKGVLSVLEIQGASGKRLPVAEFLRGYHLPCESTFT